MPIILPHGLTSEQIRVLQEFRRLNAETLPLETIKAIKHPSGGGEAPAVGLTDSGWLTVDGGRENFTLTQRAKDLLAIDPKPDVEEPAEAGAAAAAGAEAGGA